MFQCNGDITMNQRMQLIILFLAVFFVVQGCGHKTNQSVVVPTENYQVRVNTYQKPGANISLVNSLVNLEVSGVEYAVDVEINSGYFVGQMSAEVSASEGLYITGGDVSPTVSLSGGSFVLPYTLSAVADGRHYLYLNTVVKVNGNVSRRALTFIVQVGEEKAETSSSVSEKSSVSKNLVVPMQAKEEIIK